jgi:SNF2 family DNA or RNA helicase
MTFFFDQSRKLLVYPDLPGFAKHQLAQAIPEAKELNGRYFAVPQNLRNSQILRLFGHPVAPVMDDYDWPAPPSWRPYQSQKLTANFLVLHPRCFVLSDMGVGKTAAALWASDWLMRQHPGMKVLIVCPLSIMQRVWSDAIFKNFLNSRRVEILYGNAEKRVEALSRPADFYIVNFDGVGIGAHTHKRFELDGFSAALVARADIRLVIIDEASAYKDAQTKRHRLARLIIGKRDYLWLMTGTPTPNAPTDAYGLAKLVNNAFGKSFTTFRLETMIQAPNSAFRWFPKRDGYELARKLLQPSIRFDIKDVWDASALTTQQREVELTAEQKKLMADLKRDLQVVVKSGQPITAVNEAAVRIKFLQIVLGAIYDAGHRTHVIDAKPRLEELKSVIEQAPGKILIFCGFTSVLTLLNKEVKKSWTCEVINGDVTQKERSRIFSAFQDGPEPRILIADPGTMAHGLDLYAAQTVIWFGPTDKAELYMQANKRAHRPGQKFPVTVVQLVATSLEREIFRRLEANISLQGALLDIVRKGEL